MPRVTLKTVAAAVGVSPATVSNAYNRPDQLSAELRERILAVAAELGFTGPDAAGRALRTGKSGAVGVLLTGHLSYAFSDPYAVGFLAGLAEIAEQFSTSLLLMPISDADTEGSTTAVRRLGFLLEACCRDAFHEVFLAYEEHDEHRDHQQPHAG